MNWLIIYICGEGNFPITPDGGQTLLHGQLPYQMKNDFLVYLTTLFELRMAG
jgi:hypothetical protein